MSTVIRVPENLYARLEKHAQGFDSPANVIEKLINYYEGLEIQIPEPTDINSSRKKRDTTKYSFNNNSYGKSKVVLAVIKDYVKCNPEVTYDAMLTAFPKQLQGSTGVFNELKATEEKFKKSVHKLHFMQDIINLKDCDIVVSTEWGISNINNFLKEVERFGYSILPKRS